MLDGLEILRSKSGFPNPMHPKILSTKCTMSDRIVSDVQCQAQAATFNIQQGRA